MPQYSSAFKNRMLRRLIAGTSKASEASRICEPTTRDIHHARAPSTESQHDVLCGRPFGNVSSRHSYRDCRAKRADSPAFQACEFCLRRSRCRTTSRVGKSDGDAPCHSMKHDPPVRSVSPPDDSSSPTALRVHSPRCAVRHTEVRRYVPAQRARKRRASNSEASMAVETSPPRAVGVADNVKEERSAIRWKREHWLSW
jgi:hypothetical protein